MKDKSKKDQFDLYDKRKLKDTTGEDEEEEKAAKSKDLMNEIRLTRDRGQKLIKQIRERIIKQFRFAQNQKSLSDMIIEEQVPNIK